MSFIKCYGMFWEREHLGELDDEGPTLRGYLRKSDTSPVDLSQQAGVYVLYDGVDIPSLEVVYVGQAGRGDSNLLRRMRDHFEDRFWNRWTRFSWFGLYPIVDRVVTPTEVETPSVDRTMDHVEALLITLFEPKLNLQRGRWGQDATRVYQWQRSWDEDYDEADLIELRDAVHRLARRVKKLDRRLRQPEE